MVCYLHSSPLMFMEIKWEKMCFNFCVSCLAIDMLLIWQGNILVYFGVWIPFLLCLHLYEFCYLSLWLGVWFSFLGPKGALSHSPQGSNILFEYWVNLYYKWSKIITWLQVHQECKKHHQGFARCASCQRHPTFLYYYVIHCILCYSMVSFLIVSCLEEFWW